MVCMTDNKLIICVNLPIPFILSLVPCSTVPSLPSTTKPCAYFSANYVSSHFGFSKPFNNLPCLYDNGIFKLVLRWRQRCKVLEDFLTAMALRWNK